MVSAAVLMTFASSAFSQTAADRSSNNSSSRNDVSSLRQQIAAQQKQIEAMRAALDEINRRMDQMAGSGQVPAPRLPNRGEIASTPPVLPVSMAKAGEPLTVPESQPGASPRKTSAEPETSSLQLRVGSAYITPVGFMDFTGVYRDTDPGSGIGTNFGSFPYRSSSNVAGNLSEVRLSPQNSRIGARIDAIVKGAKVLGYWESDFLGAVPANASVSSNSYSFRLRLYWVDVRKNKFEFLGGQSWSMITPGRKGISPLPADLFYTQDIDVNYHIGLPWSRAAQFRMVYHPSEAVSMGLSLENAEQYIGGSGGGGTIVLPTALATAYANQLDNGNTTLNVPNVHPDIIAKIAFDPKTSNGHGLHFEIGAIERTFKTYNPLNGQHYTTAGGAVQANFNYELLKGFRFITNNFWSDGGGRYIFGAAPDLVVRGDGSVSLVHALSTVSGFEFTHNNTLLYTYYGGVYIGRNAVIDPANGKLVGYGYSGSSNAQNRSIQEGTIGFNQTLWKNAKYGALNLMGQYAYFTRNPWYVASLSPKTTHMNEVFLNLRYTLPGSAPTLK
jgi:hypothetical protein